MAGTAGGAARWDAAYASRDDAGSWFQRQPVMSLRMLDAAEVAPADSVIDVGGGGSGLAGALLGRRFTDVTVLDISAAAIGHAKRRLGLRAAGVQWLVADLLAWQPERSWRVWHDRAVYHFLTAAPEQRRYRQALDAATGPGAVAVLGCFAPDGPTRCSGLPVARYSPEDLAAAMQGRWALISRAREEHVTPAGAVQPFTWVAMRKHG